MSVFPASIELTRTGYDYPRLLSLPSHYEGGPNAHSLSAWTLIVAFLTSLTGSLLEAIPLLHLVSYGFFGLFIAALYALTRPYLSLGPSLLATAAAATFPTLLVQANDIYIDLPQATISLWALVFLDRRRYGAASALLAVALWVKPYAAIPAAVFSLFVLRDRSLSKGRRVLLVGLPVATLLILSVMSSAAAPADPRSVLDAIADTADVTASFLLATPDSIILVALAVLFALLELLKGNQITGLFQLALLVIAATLAFLLLNPIVTFGVPILPRYQIGVIPLVVVGIASQLSGRSHVLSRIFCVIVLTFYVLNLNGQFNPYKEHATHSLAERSFVAQDLLALQTEGIRRLEALGESMIIYYHYYDHFLFQYPEMGYTSGPISTGRSAFHDGSFRDGIVMSELPKHFSMLYEYPTIGGEHILNIWDQAKSNGTVVSETPIRRGDFTIYLIEVVNPEGSDEDTVAVGNAEQVATKIGSDDEPAVGFHEAPVIAQRSNPLAPIP